jgi:hypothetical protein
VGPTAIPGSVGDRPARRARHAGGRLERLGGRAEGDAGVIEVAQQVEHVGQTTGEPVDAVDEQHVEPASLGRLEAQGATPLLVC